jgi:hypothetical protein
MTSKPRVPKFTMAGLLDYIVELVVCEDKASALVLLYHKPLILNIGFPTCG